MLMLYLYEIFIIAIILTYSLNNFVNVSFIKRRNNYTRECVIQTKINY